MTFKAKGQDRTVKLGAKSTERGLGLRARRERSPPSSWCPKGILSDAQKAPSDYRDKTLLAFERKDVKTVGGEEPGRTGGGGWPVSSGRRRVAADRPRWRAPPIASAVSTLLEKLRAAKIKEFVTDTPKSLAEYGLDRPTRITLGVGRRRRGPTRTLRFAGRVPDKKAVYVQREGETRMLLVDDELWKAIPTSAVAFRDKTVFALRPRDGRACRAREPQGQGDASPSRTASGASPRPSRSGPTRAP